MKHIFFIFAVNLLKNLNKELFWEKILSIKVDLQTTTKDFTKNFRQIYLLFAKTKKRNEISFKLKILILYYISLP